MKNQNNILIISALIASALISSCTKTDLQMERVPVDASVAQVVDIGEGRLIELETTDASLLYEISNLCFLNDKFVVLSRETVCVFDNNGKFLFNVGQRGQGPNEYTYLSNIFIKDGLIYLFDSMAKKLLLFDENGNFVSSVKLNPDYPISDFFPLENGDYVAKTMFQGDHQKVSIASIWDKDFNFVRTIEGRSVTTGMTVKNNFSQYKDQILYWETLNDTVFAINDYNEMTAKYFIDFGKNAIPASVRFGKDVYDLIDYCGKPENADKIAGFVFNVVENDTELSFRFGFQSHTLYAFFNKENKTTQTFRFEDKTHQYKVNGGCWQNTNYLYVPAMSEIDLEQNPLLVVFDINELKANNQGQ
jgi:hypothetical protein